MYESFQGSRRKSQGVVENNLSTKHLPSIGGLKNLNMVATLPNGMTNLASRGGNDIRVGRVIKQKRQTCPIQFETEQFMDQPNSECVTPTKAKDFVTDDGEIHEQDSSNEKQSKNSDDSNSDDEDDDEAEQERLAQQQKKELDDIKEFAAANGFDVY